MSRNDTRSKGGFKRVMGMDESLFGPVSKLQVVQIGTAELLGTGLLVFLGCMGTVVGMTASPHPHLLTALSFGITVMICIQVIGHISKAHLNPAVTASLVVLGHLNLPLAAVYVFSQVLGATLGYGVLVAVTPGQVLQDPSPNGSCCAMCVNLVNEKMTPLQGLLAEFLATGILILVVCAIFDKRNAHNTDSIPIKFGLTIAAIAMAEGPYTGASMNPARSFGPAVWTGIWKNHWIFWVGPLASGFLTSAFYRFVFTAPPENPPDSQELEQGFPLTGVRDGGTDGANVKE